MNDLAAMFDAHVKAEFQDLDLEATMSTMTSDPYVHHVPTITGGNGSAGVRDFYGNHFIGQWPDDTETRQVSRTVGESQVVDELRITFTHDRPLDIMLPGIPPTGRRITVSLVVVVGFEGGKVSHEHIYWDQATSSSKPGCSIQAVCPSWDPSRPRRCSIKSAPRTSYSEAAPSLTPASAASAASGWN